MGGSRHSKNAGTMGSESQTYHERKALGYGTVRERLGKACRCPLPLPLCLSLCLPTRSPLSSINRVPSDGRWRSQDSAGNFDDCRLTLQPAVVSASPH